MTPAEDSPTPRKRRILPRLDRQLRAAVLTTCQRDWTELPVPRHHHTAPTIARLTAQTSQEDTTRHPGPPPPEDFKTGEGPAKAGTAGQDRTQPVVRAGSARYRQSQVLNGHERSRPVQKNRSSACLHSLDFDLSRNAMMGSNPTRRLPRAGGPCQRGRRRRGRASLYGRVVPLLPGPTYVVLIGRATTVPFTTDASGRMRTPTDNPTAAMTCAVRRLARWLPCSIWLWEQGAMRCV